MRVIGHVKVQPLGTKLILGIMPLCIQLHIIYFDTVKLKAKLESQNTAPRTYTDIIDNLP